ncbi:MAG TPA: dual specificity protein phosphatase family protein [Planctomycetota bacterium]|nr:dual specificity protein phosphatase family protein [Planctomycetota bacterium]
MSSNGENQDFDGDFGPDAGFEPCDLFTWVVADRVIGMSRPGPADLAALRSCGVDHVISLTVLPLAATALEEHGITGIHIPMPDMRAPSLDEVEEFVGELSSLVDAGHKVAVHCGAGLGRTGTMLACYLVSRGVSAEEAIAEVRRRRPGSVESRAQEQAVHDYETHLGS